MKLIMVITSITLLYFTSVPTFAQEVDSATKIKTPETEQIEAGDAVEDIGVLALKRDDPFEPPKAFMKVAPIEVSVDGTKTLGDLERYDVADITLVGLVWSVKKPKALVKLPDGTVHVVFRKTKIGRFNGYVTNISEGAVEVSEVIEDERSGKKESEIRYIEFKTVKSKPDSGKAKSQNNEQVERILKNQGD